MLEEFETEVNETAVKMYMIGTNRKRLRRQTRGRFIKGVKECRLIETFTYYIFATDSLPVPTDELILGCSTEKCLSV